MGEAFLAHTPFLRLRPIGWPLLTGVSAQADTLPRASQNKGRRRPTIGRRPRKVYGPGIPRPYSQRIVTFARRFWGGRLEIAPAGAERRSAPGRPPARTEAPTPVDARQQAPEVRLESLNLMPTGRSALRPYCGQWSASADRRVGAGRRAARSAQRGRFQSGGIRRLTQSVNPL